MKNQLIQKAQQYFTNIACDWYVAKLEGESPLQALVRRTVRKGNGVHREVESKESRIQNADLTNRKCRLDRGLLRTRMRMNPTSNTYQEEVKDKETTTIKSETTTLMPASSISILSIHGG